MSKLLVQIPVAEIREFLAPESAPTPEPPGSTPPPSAARLLQMGLRLAAWARPTIAARERWPDLAGDLRRRFQPGDLPEDLERLARPDFRRYLLLPELPPQAYGIVGGCLLPRASALLGLPVPAFLLPAASLGVVGLPGAPGDLSIPAELDLVEATDRLLWRRYVLFRGWWDLRLEQEAGHDAALDGLAEVEARLRNAREVAEQRAAEARAVEAQLAAAPSLAERTALAERLKRDRLHEAHGRTKAAEFEEACTARRRRAAALDAALAPAASHALLTGWWTLAERSEGGPPGAPPGDAGAEFGAAWERGLRSVRATLDQEFRVRLSALPGPSALPAGELRSRVRRRWAWALVTAALALAALPWSLRRRSEPAGAAGGTDSRRRAAADTRTTFERAGVVNLPRDAVQAAVRAGYASLSTLHPHHPVLGGRITMVETGPQGAPREKEYDAFYLRQDLVELWRPRYREVSIGVQEQERVMQGMSLKEECPHLWGDAELPWDAGLAIEVKGRSLANEREEVLLQTYIDYSVAGSEGGVYVAFGPGEAPGSSVPDGFALSWLEVNARTIPDGAGRFIGSVEVSIDVRAHPDWLAELAGYEVRIPEIGFAWDPVPPDGVLRSGCRYTPEACWSPWGVVEVHGRPRAGGAPRRLLRRAVGLFRRPESPPAFPFVAEIHTFVLVRRGAAYELTLALRGLTLPTPDYAVVEPAPGGFDIYYPLRTRRIGRIEECADGYRIYRIEGGREELVTTVPGTPAPPLMRPPPAGGPAQRWLSIKDPVAEVIERTVPGLLE